MPTTSDTIPLKRVGYRTTYHVLEQSGFSIKDWTINPSICVFSQGVGGVGALMGMRPHVVLRVECTLSHPVLDSASPPRWPQWGLECTGRDQDRETKPSDLPRTETLVVLCCPLFSPLFLFLLSGLTSQKPSAQHKVTPSWEPPAEPSPHSVLQLLFATRTPAPTCHTVSLLPGPERALPPTCASFLLCPG